MSIESKRPAVRLREVRASDIDFFTACTVDNGLRAFLNITDSSAGERKCARVFEDI